MKAKIKKIIFILSFVPYAIVLLFGVYRAFAGVEYFDTVYGTKGFVLGIIEAALAMCYIPIIPPCLVCQIAFLLRRKVRAVRELSVKKYEFILRLTVAIVTGAVILYIYNLDTLTLYQKHLAKEMLEDADEKIVYYTNEKHKSGIFGLDDVIYDTLLIDYDTHKVGVILKSGRSEFWNVTLEKAEADSDVLEHIRQDYCEQTEIPLSSPGACLMSYSRNESMIDYTVAFILIMEDGSVYYIDDIKGDDTGYEPFSWLNYYE